MRTSNWCFFCFAAALATALWACGGSEMSIGDQSTLSSGCSADGTARVVTGRFVMNVPADGSQNVLVLLDNCRWCADKITATGTHALSSEGEWTSSKSADGGTSIRVDKTNSRYFNLVAADGKSVSSFVVADQSYAGFRYQRDDQSKVSCDGQ